MDYKLFHLEDFELIYEPRKDLSWINKFSSSLASMYMPLILNTFNIPLHNLPIKFKDEKRRYEVVSLRTLGNGIGFNGLEATKMLSYHDGQYELYKKRRTAVYISLSFIFIICMISTFCYFFDEYLSFSKNYSGTLLIIAYMMLAYSVIILFSGVIFGLFTKASCLLSDAKYADTLCIRTLICLIIQLSDNDVLSYVIDRKALLNRVNTLARNTMLISKHNFSSYDANRAWAQKHFKHIKLYIRERERWVLAPTRTTLVALRQDFYELAKLYLSGDYGSFIWQSEVSLPEDRPRTWLQFLASTGIHILVAVLPLIMMGYLLWESQWITSAGLQSVITLIFIAWFLIVIDAFLKIGIVDKLVSIGKGIKELKN